MITLTCCIPSSVRSYEIEIEHGLLANGSRLADYLATFRCRCVIITDDKVATLYGEPLKEKLSQKGLETLLFSFPGGEVYKTRRTKELLEDRLFENGLGRDTIIITLGGGIVTDLGGYLAATYCRGVSLVVIPTSFLAMVDASLGGKTGVNIPSAKNMVGCIYQPRKVFIDPSTLKTLPPHEIRNGFVEMIKHGLIADLSFFDFLEAHADRLIALEEEILEQAILQSCLIKKEIVESDENEKGKRHLLNAGHTIGHALETLTDYTLSHGEAVAVGLIVESRIAVLMGHLDLSSFQRIQDILVKYGVSLEIPFDLSMDALLGAMSLDKKSLNGQPRFVIINGIGSALAFDGAYCTFVETKVIKAAWEELGMKGGE
jgi:3-dehydroquinate synthase